MHLIRRWA